jgi:hypothetical protein
LRNTTTVGGASTHQEMCMTFMDYYPATIQQTELLCASFIDPNNEMMLLGANKSQFNVRLIKWLYWLQ